MAKFILFFCFVFFLFQNSVFANAVSNKLMEELAFSEVNIFNKIYSKDSIDERLERLEVAVYGAIQSGDTDRRIKKIKKSVTNISSGGYGLNCNNRIFDMAGSSVGNYNWGFSNTNSSRILLPNYRSRRVPHHHLPRYYYPNHPLSINGNSIRNYSLGSGIKILNE